MTRLEGPARAERKGAQGAPFAAKPSPRLLPFATVPYFSRLSPGLSILSFQPDCMVSLPTCVYHATASGAWSPASWLYSCVRSMVILRT